MKTVNLPLTPDQIRDIHQLVDTAVSQSCERAKALDEGGRAKAASKARGYADRLLDLMDVLEPAIAALDVSKTA